MSDFFKELDAAVDQEIADQGGGSGITDIIGFVTRLDYGLKVLMKGASNPKSFFPLSGKAIVDRKSTEYKQQRQAIVEQVKALATSLGFEDTKDDAEKAKEYFKATKLRPAIAIVLDKSRSFVKGKPAEWPSGDRWLVELMEVWDPDLKKNVNSEGREVTYASMRDTGSPPGSTGWYHIKFRKSPSGRKDGSDKDVYIPYLHQKFASEKAAMVAVAEMPTGDDVEGVQSAWPGLTEDQTAVLTGADWTMKDWQGVAVPQIQTEIAGGKSAQDIAGEYLANVDDRDVAVAIVNAVVASAVKA